MHTGSERLGGGSNGSGLPTTVGAVVWDICRHPWDHLLRRWNWKAALVSVACRGALFFAVNATVGWDSAMRALVTELLYRAPMVGTFAAVSQSFRRVQPAWAAAGLIMVAIPVMAHLIEFTMHWWRGTARLAESVAASVAFSMLTVLTTYLLQRRGLMVVGADGKPFVADVLLAPQVLVEVFIAKPAARFRKSLLGAAAASKGDVRGE
ncbi:MAG: hypothetical protein OXN89_20240 [Bryobacterales bacterium]|nr:hypothetical protein [Bryobacterales bacterium]